MDGRGRLGGIVQSLLYGAQVKPITIVGGGLAGLSLGVVLRQRSIPVVVWEAGMYPRHRVCGEFLSGLGQEPLSAWGVIGKPGGLGREARTVGFYEGVMAPGRMELEKPAVCCSRYELDYRLARLFESLGGELRVQSRWTGGYASEGIVRASGRICAVRPGGWRWIGLKAHARGVKLDADLEMHFENSGYVGLCEVSEGTVNVCGIFRSSSPIAGLNRNWKEHLSGDKSSTLRGRMGGAEFDDESFSAVTGFSFHPNAKRMEGCAVGDAVAVVTPLTGNGMSMAIESALIAAELLEAYSRDHVDWKTTEESIWTRQRQRFWRRLWAGWLVHEVLFQPVLRGSVGRFFLRRRRWLERLFRWTRSLEGCHRIGQAEAGKGGRA